MAKLRKRLLIKTFGAIPRGWVDSLSHLRWHSPLIDRVMTFAARGVRNADLLIQHGAGQGLLFNSGASHPSFLMGTCEPSTQFALNALLDPGMTFFDIGANVGYLTVIAARLVGPQGRVVSFEPLAVNLRLVGHNAAINNFENVRLVETAIGRSDTVATLWLSSENSWGKLAETGKVPNRMIGEVTVRLQRLDSWMVENRSAPPDLVKIDVEGAEVDVLEGAAQLLREHRPRLLIELHDTNVGVHDALLKFDYKSTVLDDTASILDTRWDAHVVAIPCEQDWPAGLPAPGLAAPVPAAR
jgi:FkbM family methyltransferase